MLVCAHAGGPGPLGAPSISETTRGTSPMQTELRGTAAAGAAVGPNIFTAIAYETGAAAGQVARRHAFVASAAGTVFQVDYPRWGPGGRSMFPLACVYVY